MIFSSLKKAADCSVGVDFIELLFAAKVQKIKRQGASDMHSISVNKLNRKYLYGMNQIIFFGKNRYK
jgi:hypothetical protein